LSQGELSWAAGPSGSQSGTSCYLLGRTQAGQAEALAARLRAEALCRAELGRVRSKVAGWFP